MHYRRWVRTGSPLGIEMPAIERFMLSVDKTGPNGCWLWTGTRRQTGYGKFNLGRGQYSAHRWLYGELRGRVPIGLDLDHLCRVRHCVNPDHLEPVTRQENLRRGIKSWHQAAKTHCPRGHPYDSENTSINKAGARMCRTCRRMYDRVRRQRLAANS